jgi:hypothetical protein
MKFADAFSSDFLFLYEMTDLSSESKLKKKTLKYNTFPIKNGS